MLRILPGSKCRSRKPAQWEPFFCGCRLEEGVDRVRGQVNLSEGPGVLFQDIIRLEQRGKALFGSKQHESSTLRTSFIPIFFLLMFLLQLHLSSGRKHGFPPVENRVNLFRPVWIGDNVHGDFATQQHLSAAQAAAGPREAILQRPGTRTSAR